MSDKQEILSLAVPELIQSLTNPRCVDASGIPAATQPTGPTEACPSGTTRQFHPVRDMHIGVITTSIGGHGGDACPGTTEPMENDRARLISRAPGGGNVATYQDLGFLAWDPAQQLDPPGQADVQKLTADLTALVVGSGQVGCGYEAQLESWYRFLIEPNPYQTIAVQGGAAVPQGTDNVLLEQRRDFLRPNSVLGILVLSDENDCSIRDGGQYYYAAQVGSPGGGVFHLPRPQSACATDPSDPCCRSCGQDVGQGCPAKGAECEGALSTLEDQANLRCWDQKRRFGIDFLYPIDRYVSGLQDPEITDRDGNVVRNPLFSDLNPNDTISEIRDAGLVFLTSIQGVPWQDIARQDPSGKPDLKTGRDSAGRDVGAFQSAAELEENGVWPIILGDPSHYYASAADRPTDPLMIESVTARQGSNPVTGDALAPPGAATMANPINGHEYSIPASDDLQYVCIFPLAAPRDCSLPNQTTCDCTKMPNDNPLCQNDQGAFGTTQYRAKAYPGLRQLELIRALGSQGVVGSICPAQTAQPTTLDFGYVPTVRTLVESLQGRLFK